MTQKSHIPFSTIIDADHKSLSRLAAHIVRPSLPLSTRLSLLTSLLCRLVRHDWAEESIMRPAFTQYLGSYGAMVANQDREDHATLKRRLVELYELLEAGGYVDEDDLLAELKALSGEMAQHMKEESGVVLPKFEKIVDQKVSLELGARYARALVVTPDVEIQGAKAFANVMEYARADVEVFREVLEKLERDADAGRDGGYLNTRVEVEMKNIGLDGHMRDGEVVDAIRKTKEKL